VDRLGVVLPVVRSFAQAAERVRAIEELGCESVWVPQQEYSRDALLALAAYAQATTRIGLGTAVLPIHARHPTGLVQAAATLDELSGGRFRLGVGVGHRSVVGGAWGIDPGRPVEAMRECLTIVRAGLAEGLADVEGRRFTAHWSYSAPRRPALDILVGASGPRMLELAGELADGVILFMATPRFLESVAMPALARGLARSGRSLTAFEVAVIFGACQTSDPAATTAIMASMLEPALGFGSYRRVLEAEGLAEPGSGTRMSSPLVGALAAVGSRRVLRDRVRAYRAAGCTLPIAMPCPNHPGAAGWETTLAALG
jgi:alkanesulfonate monooxygenase SsuD/methylene tetrahydromethanopterin reductase-like flavin-dependent oxidoreductase (luciferase family)